MSRNNAGIYYGECCFNCYLSKAYDERWVWCNKNKFSVKHYECCKDFKHDSIPNQLDSIGLLAMELESKVTPEVKNTIIPLVLRYFHLEDKSVHTAAENEEMKKLEAEINI